ncbi:MAG TPA: ABC transporter ATP-binding protein [Ramlibacter sp.]|nr:ABC transporter ATP-binding protein [Ramlibacter sp.]
MYRSSLEDAAIRHAQPSPGLIQQEQIIHLRDLEVRFGSGPPAVTGVSFGMRPGEFVSLVGPSGCGKTTVLNVVAGLVASDKASGVCTVAGKAPRAGNTDIAYMLARDALCPWLTTLQNAEIANSIRGVARSRTRETALRLLEDVGLGHALHAFPKELSHGMRQRVALARTFSIDSSVLLMDEPFGALDVFTKIQLADVLLKLWEKERKTVLFVTHDLSEAIALSDRVLVMGTKPGRIVADIRIDLERPRSIKSLQTDARFHELLSEVWSRLQEGTEI